MWSRDFLNYCIPKKLDMEVRIKFVGFHKKRRTFEVKSYCQVLSTSVQAICHWKSI